MMEDSMTYFERMWQIMNSCIGTPTLYGGNEFAQTGYETPSKNVYLGIRNQVLHDLKEDSRYKKYYNDMQAISGLYNKVIDGKRPLTALRDGAPISLEMVSTLDEEEQKYNNDAKTNAERAGIHEGKLKYLAEQVFKYIISERSIYEADGKFKNITMNNLQNQIVSCKDDAEAFAKILKETLCIGNDGGNHEAFKENLDLVFDTARSLKELKDKTNISMWPVYKKDSTGSEVVSVITNLGLPQKKASFETTPNETITNYETDEIPLINPSTKKCPFENGTILVRINSYGKEDSEKYIVQNGTIVKEKGGPITLSDTVTIFYPKK